MVLGMEFYETTIAQYCDYVKKRQAYVPAWPDIEILTFQEFNTELDRDLRVTTHVLFISKGEYDCLINWNRY